LHHSKTHQKQKIEEEQQILDHRLRNFSHLHDESFFNILSVNPKYFSSSEASERAFPNFLFSEPLQFTAEIKLKFSFAVKAFDVLCGFVWSFACW
jgi:hypothetical protein